MEEGGEEEKSRVRSRTGSESLGWLTESVLMPKKHKAIEGVGPSSIVDLKAQLYRTQQQNLNHKSGSESAEFLRARKKFLPPAADKNSGVDARAKKDKLELKAVKDGSVSYAALEKKAELYQKLARGELPDDEDKEKYCVDFFQKSFTRDESGLLEGRDLCYSTAQENGDGEPDDEHKSSRLAGPGQASAVADNDEHKRFVREVHEEASEAREKASTIKLRRQEQESARREKLRQAYLRKQLEKLISKKGPVASDK